MRVTYRIPTEMYAYIEMEQELDATSTPIERIAEEYRRVRTIVQGGKGITDKEMNRVIDNLLLENGENHLDTWDAMSREQQEICQAIKRGLNRIKNKI